MSQLFKDINSIWFRLFDHRGFLSGEIQFLLHELEQKRNDKEVDELFAILENITNIKDTQIARAKQLIDSLFPQARVDLGQALQTCKQIEELEQQSKHSEILEANREKRRKEWEAFIEGISDRCLAIDQVSQEKEAEVREYYKDLETKLHQNS